MEGGGKHPTPPVLHQPKKPGVYRVKAPRFSFLKIIIIYLALHCAYSEFTLAGEPPNFVSRYFCCKNKASNSLNKSSTDIPSRSVLGSVGDKKFKAWSSSIQCFKTLYCPWYIIFYLFVLHCETPSLYQPLTESVIYSP